MLRIVAHIEQLLLMHDCIIIPKFGGFVLQTISTSYDKAENLFSPMRKEVVFNVTLQYNDGLLLESYMQKYGVDYRKAQLMLDEDVDALKAALQQDKRVALGIVGSFRLGEEGQVVFDSNEVQTFSLESYGLPAFHFPALSASDMEGAVERMDMYPTTEPAARRSVRWGFMRVVAASAAAVALFLVVSTPVKEVNQAAYTASFIPTEMVTNRVAATELPSALKEAVKMPERPAAEVKTTAVAETRTADIAKVKAKNTAKVKTAVAERVKANAAPKTETAKGTKTFHIVIASFPTEAQANEYLAEVDRSVCRNVNKIVSKGKYRVYADKYTNRKEAETYLSKLRSHPKYKDAWLFITR